MGGLYRGAVINDIVTMVRRPPEVSKETWFANQFIKIYKECSMVSSMLLNGCCTMKSCPKMKAGANNYLWEDEPGRGKAVSAPEYIKLVLDNAQAMLNDKRLFPQNARPVFKVGVNNAIVGSSQLSCQPVSQFPAVFVDVLNPWFRRFYRVYCHFYRHHLSQMETLDIELRVRYCFAYSTFFAREFDLLPPVEMQAVDAIIKQWEAECDLDLSSESQRARAAKVKEAERAAKAKEASKEVAK